jgi:IrrE N-terminal-like domain
MNTTARGDAFEDEVHEFICDLLSEDLFYLKRDSCRVFKKKPYFSRDRQSEIVFDIAIESYLPGHEDPSVIVIIECKNYSHAVPVDDAEEFFQKIQQVSGANTKGIIATPRTFQSGTIAFSRSKGIALLQYLGPRNGKWHLSRTARNLIKPRAYDEQTTSLMLQREAAFDDYDEVRALIGEYGTSSLNSVIQQLVLDCDLPIGDRSQLLNTSARRARERLSYKSKSDIERSALTLIASTKHRASAVPIEEICANLRISHGLLVERNLPRPNGIDSNTLGCISFEPPHIAIFDNHDGNIGRERFTLAHEIGHLVLDHSKYLRQESVDRSDLARETFTYTGCMLIDRMEW